MSEQRVALVSGASRGIGREVARQLAADHGFRVLAGARDTEAAGEADHASIEFVPLDVTDQESVDRLRERIEAESGRLDVLVNNAGVAGGHEPVSEFDLGEAQEVLDVNLTGAWRLSKAMLPLLRRSGHGRIVNTSSGMGQLSEMNGGSAAYRISKAGLNALTRILSEEESDHGVLVNSVCPGWVRTDMGGEHARSPVDEGADTQVWLATAPDDGPSGGFFRNREPIPW